MSKTLLFPGPGGALMATAEIPGVTRHIDTEEREFEIAAEHVYYGGEWFIGESMTRETMQTIAAALGYEFVESPGGEM